MLRGTTKHPNNRISLFLLVTMLCMLLFSVTASAKTTTTITVTDTLLNIGDSLDLRDITGVTKGYDGTLSFAITAMQYTGAAELKGTRLYAYKAGRLTITVTAPATASYTEATEILYVNVMGKTLSFQPTDQTVALSSGTVDLRSMITLPSDYTGSVTFTSSNKSVATVKGSTATLVAGGSTQITVTANASEIYSAAKKTFTLTVTAAAPTITVKPISVSADVGSINLNNYVSAGSYPGTFQYSITQGASLASVSGSTLTIKGAGTVKMTVTAPAAGGYSTATKDFSVTISPVAALTGFKSSSVTMGSTVDLSTLVTKNGKYTGAITYTVASGPATITGSTLTPTGAGAIRVTAKTGATAIFSASELTATITASRRATSLTATSVTKYRDDAPVSISSLINLTPGYDGTVTATVEGNSVSLTGGNFRYERAGTSVIHVTAPQTDSYESAAADFRITVQLRPSAMQARDIVLTRTAPSVSLSDYYQITSGTGTPSVRITEGSEYISVTNGTVRANKVGTAKITLTLAETAGYAASTAVMTVTVSGEQTSLTNKGTIRTEYGENAIRLTDHVSVTSGYDGDLQVNVTGDAVTYRNGLLSPALAGSATVTVTAPATTWYASATTTFDVIVAGKSPELKLTRAEVTTDYGSDTFTVKDFYATASGYDGEVSAEVTTGKNVISLRQGKIYLESAGSAVLTITAGATKRYLEESRTVTFTVRPISPKLTTTPGAVLCGGAAVDLTGLVDFANDSKQKPTFTVEKGKDIAEIKENRLSVNELGEVQIRVSLPEAEQYAQESAVIQITTVEVSMDDIKPAEEGFYNQSCTAKIRVLGDNFRQSDYPDRILSSTDGQPKVGEWKKTGEISTLEILFDEDGTYTFHSDDRDRSVMKEFVIDTVAPKVSVTCDISPSNKLYYNETVTATIRITDKNAKGCEPEILAEQNGKQIASPKVSEWKTDKNGVYATVVLSKEGTYRILLNVEDKAGKKAEEFESDEMVLDFTSPEVTVDGIEDGKIYREDIHPVIIYSDTHAGDLTASIKFSGTRHEDRTLSGTVQKTENGGEASYTITAGERDEDDAYTITISFTDLAGNETTKTVHCGINCFGSEYRWDNEMPYLTGEESVFITETNVSTLLASSITLGCNGNTRSLMRDTDYTVEESMNEGIYVYRYTIFPSCLSEDGYYEILLSSEDAAGNRQSNTLKDCPVRFTADRTAPVYVVSGLTDGAVYNEQTHIFTLTVSDNVALGSLRVFSDEAEVASFSQDELERNGGRVTVSLPENNSYQTVRIVLTDLASNTAKEEPMQVLIATNPLVRFMSNTPLLITSVLAVLAAIGAVIFLIVRKRRKTTP